MRLALSSAAFFGRMLTEDCAAHACSFPVDACEVFLETFSEYTANFGALVRGKMGILPCSSVHPIGTQFEPHLFSRYERQVEDAFRIFEGVCRAGEALGAQYYVLHGPFGVHSPMHPGRVFRLQETFERMQRMAAAHGLKVLWENVYWCTVKTAQDVQEMRRLLPEAEFVLDVKQAFRAGSTPEEMIGAMEGRIRHVHLMDADENGRICLPGQGRIDFAQLGRRLRDAGFDGTAVLEPYTQQPEDEDALRASLSHLRECLQV